MKKKGQGRPAGDSPHKHLAAAESNVFHALPSLVAHCCVTKYDDNDPRKPGWFTVKTMGTAWIVEAKDPDTSSRLTATAATLDDALALADLLLSSDDAPWEIDPWMKKQAGAAKKN